MAIAPASLPPSPCVPAAIPAAGVAAIPGEDAILQTSGFAQLLATGLSDITAGKPAAELALRADELPPDDSGPRDALPAGTEPPVLAFVFASLNHPAAAPVPAGTLATAGPDTIPAGHAAPAVKTGPSADAAGIARDKALPAAGESYEHDLMATETKAARQMEASLAESLGTSPAPAHVPALAGTPAPLRADPSSGLGVSTPVGAPGWGEELGSKVLWMVRNGEQVASLRLNPPDLGPVEIRVTLNGEQGTQATVQFASAHASVREAIQTAMPNLHAMLADSGIRLDQSSVSAESFRDQGAQAERRGSGGDASREPASAQSDLAPLRARSGNSLVDTFA